MSRRDAFTPKSVESLQLQLSEMPEAEQADYIRLLSRRRASDLEDIAPVVMAAAGALAEGKSIAAAVGLIYAPIPVRARALDFSARARLFVSPEDSVAAGGVSAPEAAAAAGEPVEVSLRSPGLSSTGAASAVSEGLDLSSPTVTSESSSDGEEFSFSSGARRRPMGFTPVTPQRHNESASIIPLPSAEIYSPAEIAVGRSLMNAAATAIAEGDLDDLKKLVLDHTYLRQIELDTAKANAELADEFKELQVELDFYNRFIELLKDYPKTQAEFDEKIREFVEPRAGESLRRIKTLSKARYIFISAIKLVKDGAINSFSRYLEENLASLGAAEKLEKEKYFKYSLDQLLRFEGDLPSYCIKLITSGTRLLAELSRSSAVLSANLDDLKLQRRRAGIEPDELSRLDSDIEWYVAALQFKQELVTEELRIGELDISLSALRAAALDLDIADDEKLAIHSRTFLSNALQGIIKIRIRLLNSLTDTAPEHESEDIPLVVDELRDQLVGLVDSVIKHAYHNYKIVNDKNKILDPSLKWVSINRSNIDGFADAFSLKLSKRLAGLRRHLYSLSMDVRASIKQVEALINREIAAAEKQRARIQAKVDHLNEKLSARSEAVAERNAFEVEARQRRLKLLLGDQYSKYLADCAADKASGAGERFPTDEERIMHYRSGAGDLALRSNRLKIMMSEGLSPNAADAKKETLLFLVLKARVSRDLKYEMINYLFSQGASAIVINSDGCEPGGLLAHDTEMQNFLSDVCVLQEEDQPFHDRILSFAEEMTESVDRYQINQRTRIQSILYQLFMYNPKTLAMRDEEKIKYRDIVAEIRIKHFMIEALIKQVMLVYDQSYWGPMGKTTLHGPVKKHVEAFRACEPYGVRTKKIASERPIYSQRVARQIAEAYRSKDEEVMRRDRQIAELLRRMGELESNAGSSRRPELDSGSSRRLEPEGRGSDASRSAGLFRSIPASAEVSASVQVEVVDGSARATMS